MDRVFDLGCKMFLKKMQNCKVYSCQEINKLILENFIQKPQLVTNPDSSANKILDMAYIEAVIQAQ